MALDVGSAEWIALLNGVVSAQCNLLLGAGFSLGFKDAGKQPLPSNSQLANELIAHFQLPAESNSLSLSRVYAACKYQDSDKLAGYLTKKFVRCRQLHGWI